MTVQELIDALESIEDKNKEAVNQYFVGIAGVIETDWNEVMIN